MTIRSNPPGAQVFVDDYEIGTTPASTGYTYYGTRKIRLVKDGYETLTVYQPMPAPWYDFPGVDFFSENIWPCKIRDERAFDYQMSPMLQVPTEELKSRAEQLQRQHHASGGRAPVVASPPGVIGPPLTAPAIAGPPVSSSGVLPPPADATPIGPLYPSTVAPQTLPPASAPSTFGPPGSYPPPGGYGPPTGSVPGTYPAPNVYPAPSALPSPPGACPTAGQFSISPWCHPVGDRLAKRKRRCSGDVEMEMMNDE